MMVKRRVSRELPSAWPFAKTEPNPSVLRDQNCVSSFTQALGKKVHHFTFSRCFFFFTCSVLLLSFTSTRFYHYGQLRPVVINRFSAITRKKIAGTKFSWRNTGVITLSINSGLIVERKNEECSWSQSRNREVFASGEM